MFAKKLFSGAVAAALLVGVSMPAFASDGDLAAAEAKVREAQVSVDLVCTEGAESYDMAACADEQDKLKAAQAKLDELKAAAPAPAPKEAPVPVDTVKEGIKDAELDATYFCAENTEYYDMAKCADSKGKAEELKKKDAELDATYFCAENTEYYDVVKCADAKAKIGSDKKAGENAGQSAAPNNTDPKIEQPKKADDKKAESKKAEDKKADAKKAGDKKADAKKADAKKGLAKTGAEAGLLAGIAALAAGAGVVALVARKRS